MKIELMEDGLDVAINDIRYYLGLALSTKDKKEKRSYDFSCAWYRRCNL